MTVTTPASTSFGQGSPEWGRRQPRSGRLVAYILVYGLLATWPLLSWWGQFHSGSERVLIFCLVALCVLGAAVGTYDGLRPLILVASAFSFCWLAVPASYQIATTTAAWQDNTVTKQIPDTEHALLICVGGQLFLLLGYVVAGWSPRVRAARDRGLNNRQLAFYRRVSTVALIGAAALLPVVLSIVGGLDSLFSSRSALNKVIADAGYTSANTGIFTLVKLLPAQLCIVAALVSIAAMRSAPRLPRTQLRAFRFKLFASLILLVAYANPVAHTRFIFLAAFGSIALMFLWTRGRRTALVTLLLCLITFLFAYPAADYFRNSEDRQIGLQTLATSDFDGFQQTINTVTMVQATGHTDGSHVISGVLYFVPRSIWEDKAAPANFEVAQARGYSFKDLSLPISAELYLDLGWGGLILVAFGAGILWRRLDRAYRAQTSGAMLASYLAIAQIGIIRGPLGSLAPVYGTVVILLLAVFLRARSLNSAEPGESHPG